MHNMRAIGACIMISVVSVMLLSCASPHSPSWSIATLTIKNPLEFTQADLLSPSFTAAMVTDCPARFVADPFLLPAAQRWYLFFEIFCEDSQQGKIGYAESADGLQWQYQQTVLNENFHLSYPQVFKHAGSFYLIPESRNGGGIRLYQATSFPREWRFVKMLVQGDYADPSIIFYKGRWWLFAVEGAYSLAIFYSDSLIGPWQRHAISPFYTGDKGKSRPGGRMIMQQDRLVRFAQDGRTGYGKALRAFYITKLTPTEFEEVEIEAQPLLSAGGNSWRSQGMHQLDAWQLQDGSSLGV